MEILILSLLVLTVILLSIVLVKLFSNKKELSDRDILRIKEETKKDFDSSFYHTEERSRAESEKIGQSLLQMDDKLKSFISEMNTNSAKSLQALSEANLKTSEVINHNFDRVRDNNATSFKVIEEKTEKLSKSVEEGMTKIRESNEQKLKEIQGIVDIKLQETLDKRISMAFTEVTTNLNKLHETMGNLNALSTDVKKMNNIFSNVKSRGVWGEVQVEKILSDYLTSDEWVKNYAPRGGREVVEFAICLPGKKESEVYLPIDSKFPITDFEEYRKALDEEDEEKIKVALKDLKRRITDEAKDINRKYIVIPQTTDFAILYLPSESIYMEIIKMDGFSEELQMNYRVVLSGPNNFAALLNSLSLGFKSLQIEEYTSTIWKLFENLKGLFQELSKSIDSSKKSVDKAQEELDKTQTKRKKLEDVLNKIECNSEKCNLLTNNEESD